MNCVIKSTGQSTHEVKTRKRIFKDLEVGDIFINFCDGELYLSTDIVRGNEVYNSTNFSMATNAINLSTGSRKYIMWDTEVAVYKGKVIFDEDMFDDETEVEE